MSYKNYLGLEQSDKLSPKQFIKSPSKIGYGSSAKEQDIEMLKQKYGIGITSKKTGNYYEQIKKVPEELSNLRQTITNTNYTQFKKSINEEPSIKDSFKRSTVSKPDNSLRHTVYERKQQYSGNDFSYPSSNTYTANNQKLDKLEAENKYSVKINEVKQGNTQKVKIDYDKINQKLKNNALMIEELRRLKQEKKMRKQQKQGNVLTIEPRKIQTKSVEINALTPKYSKQSTQNTIKNQLEAQRTKYDTPQLQKSKVTQKYQVSAKYQTNNKYQTKYDTSKYDNGKYDIGKYDKYQTSKYQPSKYQLQKSKYEPTKYQTEKSKYETQKKTESSMTTLDKSKYQSPVIQKSKYESPKVEKSKTPYVTPTKSKQVKETNLGTIGDFLLMKALGEGKFGQVFLSIHKPTGGIFALKKVPKNMIKEHYLIDQFILELKIQSYFEHSKILKIFGFFDDKQSIYLILEYMEEGTLFSYLKKRKTLSEKDAASKIRDVSEAVHSLHQKGVAHRDIKPQNIVMSYGVCKLCDFGWATICNERRKTYCGTFDYAAPEILEGVQYDMSVDTWCLGILAYELMVGKAPFYHISRKETMKKIMNVDNTSVNYPESMSKLAISFIENLIIKNPEKRMSSDQIINHQFLQIKQEFQIL